jgi:hypothetical protein
MTRVITIAREYGSGGGLIGSEVAKLLGWKLLDRELITELALRAGVQPSEVATLDERPRAFIASLMKAFWMGNIETWSGRPATAILDEDYVAQLSAIVIAEAAKLGECVIVGRGAQCVLRQRDLFHIFVYGSTAEKTKRIQARHPSSQDVQMEMREIDKVRAAYIRTYYHCIWDDRHLYNLMIDSDVGIDRAVETILCASGLWNPDKH